MTFRDEFKDFIEANKISQNKAGEGAGYTGSVISQWLSGNYKGDTDAVEAALRTWMERERSRRASRSIPIIETETMRRITNAIGIAHQERDIAVVVGAAGTGKTTALRRYVHDNPNTAILIEVDDSMNKVALIQELAERLGLSREGGHVELVKKVASTLAERDVVVLIDEADYLNDGALELCRRIVNDKGRSGLVLAGLQRLVFRIKSLKNDHQQLASRVGIMVEVESIKPADAEKLVQSVWPELAKETVQSFVKFAGGSVRYLVKHISRAHLTAVANGKEEPDPDIVRVAGALLCK